MEVSDNQIASSADVGNGSELPLDMSVGKKGPVEESDIASDENQSSSKLHENDQLINESSVNNATTS